jgi:hypothetical protein
MELLELAPGWLDGEAVPPTRELLELVGAWLDEHQLQDLEQPRLFPTPIQRCPATGGTCSWTTAMP